MKRKTLRDGALEAKGCGLSNVEDAEIEAPQNELSVAERCSSNRK